MAAEDLDLKAQYTRNPKVVPTVILQLEEGKLMVTTGPRPVPREEYIYDWDTTWDEPGTDIVAVDTTIQWQKTVADQPVMVNRVIDDIQNHELGQWIIDVLNGKDPR